jgi:hypothetical protein
MSEWYQPITPDDNPGTKDFCTITCMDDPRKDAFIDWLCTPVKQRQPEKQGDFAKQLGVDHSTLSGWKKDKDFLDAWDLQYKRTIGSPERSMAVIDALERTAKDEEDPRQVPAARAFLEAVGAIKPPKVDVTINKGAAKDMSDDELMAALAEHAAREFERRGKTVILDAAVPQVIDYTESAEQEN